MQTNAHPAATPAWLLLGGSRRVGGTLHVADARVSFRSTAEVVFDASIGDVRAHFPWHYLGCGLQLVIGRNTYRLWFLPVSPRFPQVVSARRAVRAWRSVVASEAPAAASV